MIDTNVILDIFLKREPFFGASYQAVRRAIEQQDECVVSATAATDLYYILRKNLQSRELAKEHLCSLKQIAHFADVLEKDIDAALASDMTDFEDAVVSAVAKRLNAAYIITRNTNDFSASHVPAITPNDYLSNELAAQ